jgi:multiple sugar transport system permease protein
LIPPPPARRRRSLSLSQREAIWAYVFLAIPIAFFAYIRFWPALQSFYLSLFTWHVDPARRRFVGIGYYEELLNNPVFHQALKNTLSYAAITVPASMLLGLTIALLLQGSPSAAAGTAPSTSRPSSRRPSRSRGCGAGCTTTTSASSTRC